jgi:hypothetical protein
MYPADEDDSMEDDDELLSEAVPQSVRDMVRCDGAMEALGAMIWSARIIMVKAWTFLTHEQVPSPTEY